MPSKTVLVTGSNGFIGSALVTFLLLNSSHKIVGASKGKCRLTKQSNFEYVNIDLTSSKEISCVFQKYNPDVVVHCAAISQVDVCEGNPKLCTDVNVNSTKYLVNESNKINAQFIFLSSDFVFDGTDEWVHENTIPNPISVYGKSKLAAEEIVKSSSVYWTIIRPVLVYGFSPSASRGNVFTWVLESLKSGIDIKVVEDQFRTPTFVMDVVQLISAIVETGAQSYYNIGGGERVSVYDLARRIALVSGLNDEYIHPVKSENLIGGELRPKASCFDSQKIEEELGLSPVNLNNGIERALRQINRSNR